MEYRIELIKQFHTQKGDNMQNLEEEVIHVRSDIWLERHYKDV